MPTISDVEVCNMALSHIGSKSRIESIDENSAEANECKTWFDWSRRQVLEDHNWNFARKRASLALHGDAPPAGWSYRYEYPSDCIKARLIYNPSGPYADPIPFTIESVDDGSESCILTNQVNAILIYSWELLNLGQFSSLGIDALAWRLAERVAMPLTGDKQMKDLANRGYALTMRTASGSNADEGQDRPPRDGDYIRAREG